MKNDKNDEIDLKGIWGVIVRLVIALCVIALIWISCGCTSWKSVLISEAQRYAPLMIETLEPGAEGYEGEASLIICAGNQCADAVCYGHISDTVSMIQCKRNGPYPKHNNQTTGGTTGND